MSILIVSCRGDVSLFGVGIAVPSLRCTEHDTHASSRVARHHHSSTLPTGTLPYLTLPLPYKLPKVPYLNPLPYNLPT